MPDADYLSFALAIEEVAAGDGALLDHSVSVNNSVVCGLLLESARRMTWQKETFLTTAGLG